MNAECGLPLVTHREELLKTAFLVGGTKARILICFGKYNQALQVYDEMKKLMPNDVTLDMKLDRLNKMIFDDA